MNHDWNSTRPVEAVRGAGDSGRPASPGLRALVTCVVLLPLAAPLAWADSSGFEAGADETEQPSMTSVGPQGDDESIGSLPSTAGPPGATEGGGVTGGEEHDPAPETARVVVTGRMVDLAALVIGTYGDGHTTFSYYMGVEGETMVELTMHGDMTLQVDPDQLQSDRIEIRVDTGAQLVGGFGSLTWAGVSLQPFALAPLGSVNLPAGPLVDAGVLDAGEEVVLDLFTPGRGGTSASVTLVDQGGWMELTQKID